MKQEKLIPKQISAKKFKAEIIPIIMEKFQALQHSVGHLHNTMSSAIGAKKERDLLSYNPYNPFNLNYCDGGLYFENLLVQFDVDFLKDFNQSPIIKNELHISGDIVFFAMFEESLSSGYHYRQFARTGNKVLKKLFELFEHFSNAIIKGFNDESNSYIINNLNYLDIIDAVDKLNEFCIDCSREDLKSDNNVEIIYESYLQELSSNSGLDTTMVFKLHRLKQNNPASIFKLSIHTESYKYQSYIKLFIWSEISKQWNAILVPTFEQFYLNPTQLTSINKPTKKYADRIIKFCIEFSQNFI